MCTVCIRLFLIRTVSSCESDDLRKDSEDWLDVVSDSGKDDLDVTFYSSVGSYMQWFITDVSAFLSLH